MQLCYASNILLLKWSLSSRNNTRIQLNDNDDISIGKKTSSALFSKAEIEISLIFFFK